MIEKEKYGTIRLTNFLPISLDLLQEISDIFSKRSPDKKKNKGIHK